MAVQARLDWLRLTRAAKTHDQLSRRNPADVVDYSSLQVGKMIAAETTIGLLVANKSAPVGLGNPTGEAGLRRRKAWIECDHASVRRHALRQQAKQVFGYGIIHMVNDPHQHDRVEGLKLGYMSQRKMFAEKTPAVRVMLLGIFDIARLGIEADVIDRRHIIQNIPRPAANIQHTLSVSKLQEIIETDLPQAICAQHALPADIDRWRAQEIMEMGKCH
jgi:hypothetical protein